MLPGETKTGYLNPQVILRRELYPAMERAGIPRIGPTGEKRTFHSLRHTFARIAIENNRPIFWPPKHLEHSSLDVVRPGLTALRRQVVRVLRNAASAAVRPVTPSLR